ncbi:uncharacterized protein [Pyxicephalus adspersus]|uniref:uncharacterized protein n=1 Tax=Pyxicephalus adspersus TaxID=30357 RepID=UPI003B5A2A9C
MSAGKVLLLILLFLISFLHNEAALVVFAPTPHRAHLGENIVLPCSFRVDNSSINLRFLAIVWMFQEKEVLRMDNKGISSHPRIFINKQDIPNGIANIEIRNVTISDTGQYRCVIVYSPDREYKDVDLRVYGNQKFVVSDIEVPVWTDGEKTTLTCRASNCTKDVQVTWVIQGRDGSKYEVSDTVSGDNEEEQPLILREYQVTKEKLNLRKEHHDVTTKLTFIPSISRHLGCTVTCRLTHQKNTEEKICEVKSIIAKPKFLEPVQFTLSGQGDVEISLKLQKFYSSEIEWRWFSKMGQSEKKIPSDNVISDSGNTFDLESKCSVPGELFKDPSNKVIMKWKHQSMETSQTQEFSVRDLPWHPKLQTIPIESIFQGDRVLLQCRVSDYFPNILVVKWFERKTGSPDMVEISSSDKYNISEIPSYQMENQTFSSTTVLSYSRSDFSENGVEFTCRVSALLMNNIQGPQTWYSGDKVTLYCTGSYCMEDTRVIWRVKEADGFICEITEDMRTDRDQPYGYVARRERTDVSDVKGLLDVTSSLTFTPSIAKHQNISIDCKILYGGKGKEKTFQYKSLYAKPIVSSPIKLSLTDSGEVLCSLDIEGFYPRDIQIKWNDGEISEPNRTSQNSDGTFSVRSEHKLTGSFFSGPDSAVKVSWKHDSMKDWESRQMSVRDKDINTAAVPPPEDNQQQRLHQVSQTVSETDSDIAETAHEPIWIVGEIGGPSRWIHGEKVTVYCSVSYCSEDTNVKWMVKPTDGPAEEISSNGGDSRTDSGYLLSKDIEQADREGLVNITSLLTFIPSVSKHLGVIVSCTVSCNGQTETKEFIPRSVHAKPQVLEGVKTSLCDTGDVLCSLNLQIFYPKHMKISWKSGENQLKSKEEYKENNDHTYNGHSHCTVPRYLLQDPKFTVHVTWGHKSLEKPQTEILSWRHPGLSWCPVIEEVPIPHVLSEQKNTLQYNISRYFPDVVTVRWYRKEKGEK